MHKLGRNLALTAGAKKTDMRTGVRGEEYGLRFRRIDNLIQVGSNGIVIYFKN